MRGQMKRVCIDPGHGMGSRESGRYDPGALSGRLLGNQSEADVVLMLGLTIKHVAATEFRGRIEVVLTRDDRTDNRPVGSRDEFAISQGCDCLISLHCNSPWPGHGTETFIANEATLESRKLAAVVQRAALAGFGLRDRGIKRERQTRHKRLAVLASDHLIPSCLLEVGFITSAGDLARMNDRDRRIAFSRELLSALSR